MTVTGKGNYTGKKSQLFTIYYPDPGDPADLDELGRVIDPTTEWGEYDALISQIRSETNSAIRTDLMHQAEDLLMSTYAIIPLYYYNDVYMQKDYVQGIYSNAYGTKFFMYTEMMNGSDTLRLNLASDPFYMDPVLNSTVDGACLAANCFSGLYTYNSDGLPMPACAENYQVSADGLTYTVNLKPGLKWSDGTDLTAEDFEYSWKRAADPATGADYRFMFAGFDGYDTEEGINVTAVNANTLVFVLSAPCAYMEDLMAFPTFYPVQKAWVEANAVEGDPGAWSTAAGFPSNGAYVCTGWIPDISMTFEKNPYFWDAGNVITEKLEFMLSSDDAAVYDEYNAGNLDFIDSVPTDELTSLIDSQNMEIHSVNELGTYYISFNVKSPLFDGMTPAQAVAVRKAISMLIDREFIIRSICMGGQMAATSFVPVGMADGNGGIFHQSNQDGYYDAYAITNDRAGTMNKAWQLLKAAGFQFDKETGRLSEETPLAIEYLTNASSAHMAIAEAIQADLSVVGINLSVSTVSWSIFLEDRSNGNFDMAREGWIADFNDPINMLEMFMTDSGNNDPQFGR